MVLGVLLQMSWREGAGHSGDCAQRSYPLVLEAEPNRLCVPAIPFGFDV